MKTITTIILIVTLLTPLSACGRDKPVPSLSLNAAILQGNIDTVRQHINAGTDLNKKDEWGSTPLIIATTFGKTEIAKALIENGADMTIGNNEGSTPLHIAALLCRTEIVKALLDMGIDKYIRNNSGATAFDIVDVPFDDDKEIYDKLGAGLKPLGLELDYEQIKMTRPKIAEMLRPGEELLKAVQYVPLPGDGWEVSTPVKQGLDPMLVAELYLDANELETIYGLLVVKNGYLIAEGYFNEGSVKQLSKRASVTKSYTSALVGIALAQGHLESVDQKMIEFFPELKDQITDPRKKQITIRQMLQMRAGYPWEETDMKYWDAIWTGEYLSLIEKLPLTSDPGTKFQYSNLTSHWLGIIVARACGKDLKSFGQEHLFSPLDVELGDWNQDVDGYYIGCGDIQFTARDMAKFGMLYLNEGIYKGSQIIPADWVEKSLESYSDEIDTAGIKSGRVGRYLHDIGYGYQWWSASVGGHHINFAWGHGGQLIILIDELNMIIVVTADPFWGKDLHWQAWKHEQANINLVGKFIKSLPNLSHAEQIK
jgi:CubicO group peptidase (beta-lactamase class C family)